MIWLAWVVLTLPFRLAFATLKMSVRTVRFLGVGRILAFAAGLATGLAVAPGPGRDLRAALSGHATPSPAQGPDLAAAVRHELANAPRTWHLDQPQVSVEGVGRVVLRGEVPHAEARLDLVRTAGAISGVRAVDDQLTIASAP